LLHELVLAGVGGRTVAEAKERLTYAEAVAWEAYRRKYGTLNVGLRLEIGFGQLLAAVANALGNKADPLDYMPHVPRPEPEPLSIDRVMAVLGAVAPVK
jgi:hypothetical protein